MHRSQSFFFGCGAATFFVPGACAASTCLSSKANGKTASLTMQYVGSRRIPNTIAGITMAVRALDVILAKMTGIGKGQKRSSRSSSSSKRSSSKGCSSRSSSRRRSSSSRSSSRSSSSSSSSCSSSRSRSRGSRRRRSRGVVAVGFRAGVAVKSQRLTVL